MRGRTFGVTEDVALFVRISAMDWVDGGWTIDDSIALSSVLGPLGVDLIDVSSGGLSPLQRIPVEPLYQVSFSERIRHAAGIPTGAVGSITQPADVASIVAGDRADIVFTRPRATRAKPTP